MGIDLVGATVEQQEAVHEQFFLNWADSMGDM